MNGPCKQLFAGTGLPADQNVSIAAGCMGNNIQAVLDLLAVSDNAFTLQGNGGYF